MHPAANRHIPGIIRRPPGHAVPVGLFAAAEQQHKIRRAHVSRAEQRKRRRFGQQAGSARQ